MQVDINFSKYVFRQLGPGSAPKMASNMVTRAFTSTTLRSFWRYWNAGFHFFLLAYCYRPIRSYLGHTMSLLLTFALCGFAHDIVLVLPISIIRGSVPFPFITSWFTIIAAGVLAADRIGLKFNALSVGLRVGVHVTFLLITFVLTWSVEKLW